MAILESGNMRFAVKTDKGMVRDIYEDSYRIITGYSGIPDTFIVADGMGGHNSGEVASKMAVDFVSNEILKTPGMFSNKDDILRCISDLMQKANSVVYESSLQNIENFGMGTTLIIAVACEDKLYIGHIGDSRVYLIRGDEMHKITTDHSYIEELIKTGSLTREEAQNHPKKHVITRALGCSEEIIVDTYLSDIKDGDAFIICTDGLTNMLEEEEIKRIVKNIDDIDAVCEELVRKTNENGGMDNVTVIVIRNN